MKLRFYLRGLGIGMAVTAVILHFAVAVKSHAMSDDEIRARARQLGMTESGIMLSENAGTEEGGEADVSDSGAAQQEVTVAMGGTGADEGTGSADTGATQPAGGEDTPVATTDTDPQGTDTTQGNDTPDTATQTQTTEPDDTQAATDTTDTTPAEDQGQEQQEDPAQTTQQTGNDDSPHGINPGSMTVTVVGGDSSYSVAKRMAEAGIVPSAAEFDEFLCKNGYDRTLAIGVYEIPAGASYDEMGRILTGK